MTLFFGTRQRIKQRCNNNKRKLKTARQLQRLTGDHLVNETSEVHEADPTDAQDRVRHKCTVTIRTAEVTIGKILEGLLNRSRQLPQTWRPNCQEQRL